MSKQSASKKLTGHQKKVQNDDSSDLSNNTAEFFSEQQQNELKHEESKQKILDFIKAKGIMGKQTFKEVKLELQKKFGIDQINTHKNWLISTLNSRKSETKSNTPAKHVQFNQIKSSEQIDTSINKQDNQKKSPENQMQKIAKQNSSQQFINKYEFESLNSEQEITESEISQTYSDSTFPELNQIDELIGTKFNKLTQDAMKDMYDRLLIRVPEILESKIYEKIDEKIANTVCKLEEFKEQLKKLDINQLEGLVKDGKDEIEQSFKELVDDIKKIAPTVGVATQDSLANNVR